jgi:pre-sodorifen synthase
MTVITQPRLRNYTTVSGPAFDTYQPKVTKVYDTDDPGHWQKVLGEELWYHFGLYEDSVDGLIDEACLRHFSLQLELAGIHAGAKPAIQRVLDIGCGWGPALQHLPARLPECPRFDGISVSHKQLEFASRRLAEHGLADRTNLYHCNAQDISELPDAVVPYDLAYMRGVNNHVPDRVYEACFSALASRMRKGGTVILSEMLFNLPLDQYRSPIPDEIDRVACGQRKTLPYVTRVLRDNGFDVSDQRRLPSNAEAIRWLEHLNLNIEKHFPAERRPTVFDEIYVGDRNLIKAMCQDAISVYSIVATRT